MGPAGRWEGGAAPTPRQVPQEGSPPHPSRERCLGEQTELGWGQQWGKFEEALGPAFSPARGTWLLACDVAAVPGWTEGKMTTCPGLPGSEEDESVMWGGRHVSWPGGGLHR